MNKMKIIDIITKDTLSLSFEVFPPKTESSFDSVKIATEEIAKLYPSFMSVTYGAGGGTSKYTLEIAKNIKEEFGVPMLAHLTCVSSDKETVKQRIEDMHKAGIQNIMALRGDIPESMMNDDRSKWDYRYAIDLIMLDACLRGKVQQYLLNFLKLLTENGLIRSYGACCDAYEKLYNDDNGILLVSVVSAAPLTEEQKQRLKEKLDIRTGKNVLLRCTVDPACLGGIRVDYNDQRIDGTVSNRLSNVSELLKSTAF